MSAFKYDADYFYGMLRMYSPTAKQICEARWKFVEDLKPKVVLDYGAGCGFFKAYAPKGIDVDTYDVMPVPITGIRHSKYDLICLFDVLEHIDWEVSPDKSIEKLFPKTQFMFVTVPILPIGKDFRKWKHRKPKEHLTRFKSIDAVIHFFSQRNYSLIKVGMPECPPREDIYSFLFERDDD